MEHFLRVHPSALHLPGKVSSSLLLDSPSEDIKFGLAESNITFEHSCLHQQSVWFRIILLTFDHRDCERRAATGRHQQPSVFPFGLGRTKVTVRCSANITGFSRLVNGTEIGNRKLGWETSKKLEKRQKTPVYSASGRVSSCYFYGV